MDLDRNETGSRELIMARLLELKSRGEDWVEDGKVEELEMAWNSNPNCSNCGAETTWNRGKTAALRAVERLCPECYRVKTKLEQFGAEALIECMECDQHAVLGMRKNRSEFDCKPCREKKRREGRAHLPITRGAIPRRGDASENAQGMGNTSKLLEGEGRG